MEREKYEVETTRDSKERGNKRKTVGIGYRKIKIGEQWKRDEEEEVLKDGRGNIRKGEWGKGKWRGGRE